MKKSIFLFILVLAAIFVSCHREVRMSPDIRLSPQYVVTYVNSTAIVRFMTLSDGKMKVSVADTTIATATLIQGQIFVRGVKEGMTTLKAEVGMTKAFRAGEETCTVVVRPSPVD